MTKLPTTTATRSDRRRRRSTKALLLLSSLPWMPPQQAQASTTRSSRKRTSRHGATPTQSYWGLPAAGEHDNMINLTVEYPGRHPHSRYLEEAAQNKGEEEVSKFGLRPSNSNNPDDSNNNIQNAMQDMATSSLRDNTKNGQDRPQYEFDDDFLREPLLYDHSNFANNNDDTQYEPIRIHFITTPLEDRRGESALVDQQIDELLQVALPAAAHVWSNHLSVYPVAGSIDIPPDVCYGSYSHVLFGNGDTDLDGEQQRTPAALQISNADLVIIVSAYDELATPNNGGVMPVCGLHSLALGAACALDQWDRPVVGFINLCLQADPDEEQEEELDQLVSQAFQAAYRLNQQQQQQQQQQPARQQPTNGTTDQHPQRVDPTDIMVHEVAHTLGFDSYLFKFYRNATTGEPLTPRPFETSTVRCTNNNNGGQSSSKQQVVGFPSSKVLQLGQRRRGDDIVYYYDIVTPRVAQVARNHFNCPSLAGARLENYESSCVGSHWDERLFLTDILSPALAWRNNMLSPLTLALLEDTGWYQVNYENVSTPTFGLGAGCEFVEGACIVDDKVPPYAKDYFCDHPIRLRDDGTFDMELESWNKVTCDPTHQYWAMCDLWDASTIPDFMNVRFPQGNQATQYFSDDNLQVSFPQADYCPIAHEFLGVDCQQEEDEYDPSSSSSTARQDTYLGEQVGPESRCINAFSDISGERNRRIDRPACMHAECDTELRKVVLGRGAFRQVCDYDGQVLQIPSSEADYLECPRLATICPHFFCPASCSGRGICDFKDGSHPTCKCFDRLDTSAGCYGDNGASSPSPNTGSSPDLSFPDTSFPSPTSKGHSTLLSSSAVALLGVLTFGWLII